MLSKLIVIILLVTVNLQTSWADSCEKTTRGLQLCHKALIETRKTVKIQEELITYQENAIEDLIGKVNELSKPPAFYEEPLFIGIVGAVLGGYFVHKIKE